MMGDSTPKGSSNQGGKGGVGGTVATPPPYPTMTSSNSNNSIASTGSPPAYPDVGGSNQSTEDQDMFRIAVRLELPQRDMIQEFAKFSMGEINCFAVALKK